MSSDTNLIPVPPTRRSVYRTTYLAQSIRLEDGTSPALVRALVLTLAIALFGALAWSNFALLDQVARADGQVVPSSSVHTVQHLEGGIAGSLHVRESAIVEAGDLVLTMDPTQARSELAQLEAREASLSIRLARLNAFVRDEDPRFGAFSVSHPGLVSEQLAVLEAQIKARESQKTVLGNQIKERQVALATLQTQRKTVEKSVVLIEEEVGIREELLAKGLTPRLQYLDVLRLLNNTRGQLLQVEGLIARARENVAEAESRLADLDTRSQTAAVAEIGTLSSELAEVRESMARYQDKVRRLEVRSPVRGVVQRLAVTPGAVVSPGQTVAEIVPIDDDLEIEVRLNPKDVGTVEVGMPATLRFTAYDFARYGGIDGTVTKISPTTLTTATGAPYYRVVISPGRLHVGPDPERNPVLPGMVVQADIRAGERTLLSYLTKPISRALSTSLQER